MTKRLNPHRHRLAIDDLREFCVWYEWGEPPDLGAASVLQAACDAMSAGSLSFEAADALIAVWAPFAGLESHVGNEPPGFSVAESEHNLQRAIVGDLRRMIADENHPAKRVYLTTLLDTQIQRFAEDIQ